MGAKVCVCKDYLEARRKKKEEQRKESEELIEGNDHSQEFLEQSKRGSKSLSSVLCHTMSFRTEKEEFVSQDYLNNEEKYELFEEFKKDNESWSDKESFASKSIQKLLSIHINEEPIKNYYKIGRVLGSGNFAVVKHGASLANPSFKVAIKIYKLDGSDNELLSIFREISVHQSFDHPNLVKIHEVFKQDKKLYIVCDLVKGRRLYDYILDSKKISEENAKIIVKQLLKVLEYSHSKNIMHRDLKPENVIIEPSTLQIKVIDFGSSSYFSNSNKLKTCLGTPFYIAPEVLEGEYTQTADIWSIGIITYLMLTGCPPFQDEDFQIIYQKILNEPLCFYRDQWLYLTQNAMKFVKELLVKDPHKRISLQDALAHPWLQNIQSPEYSIPLEIFQKLTNRPPLNILKREMLLLTKSQLNPKTVLKWNTLYEKIYSKNAGMASSKKLEKIAKNTKVVKMGSNKDSTDFVLKIYDRNHKFISYSDFLATVIDFQSDIPYFSMKSVLKHMGLGSQEEISLDDIQRYLTRRGYQDHFEMVKALQTQILEELTDQGDNSLLQLDMICQGSQSEESGSCSKM
ncbi:unnamed protein product [Moneuplotes crassus]|uniref:Protein kinase domain-containing protein n=1 Tax=Euplotes crassus TaxID=5936 RepID=A0AAD1Y700_EUPCR|nr:unnamed protein product [Moneuplotes crassus]